MKISPVQKQTRAGQRTRFKAHVVVGDYNGHVGLGSKCSKEVATAIRGAIIGKRLFLHPLDKHTHTQTRFYNDDKVWAKSFAEHNFFIVTLKINPQITFQWFLLIRFVFLFTLPTFLLPVFLRNIFFAF